MKQDKPKILVSACLVGQCVRYKGDSCPQSLLLNPDVRKYLVSFCPECAGGLTVPRPPAEICGKNGGNGVWQNQAHVINNVGTDVTNAYKQGALLCLEKMHELNITTAILKQRSPSCGTQTIYDGSFNGIKIIGQGVTAALLAQNNITLYSEDNLTAELLKQLLNK